MHSADGAQPPQPLPRKRVRLTLKLCATLHAFTPFVKNIGPLRRLTGNMTGRTEKMAGASFALFSCSGAVWEHWNLGIEEKVGRWRSGKIGVTTCKDIQ